MYDIETALGAQTDFSLQKLPEGETLEAEVDNTAEGLILPGDGEFEEIAETSRDIYVRQAAKILPGPGLASRMFNAGMQIFTAAAAGALLAYCSLMPAHTEYTMVQDNVGELRVMTERNQPYPLRPLDEPSVADRVFRPKGYGTGVVSDGDISDSLRGLRNLEMFSKAKPDQGFRKIFDRTELKHDFRENYFTGENNDFERPR